MDVEKIISLIEEAKRTKYCILAGAEELAYEHAQNLEDELTTVALKEYIKKDPESQDPYSQEKTSTQPPQRVEV